MYLNVDVANALGQRTKSKVDLARSAYKTAASHVTAATSTMALVTAVTKNPASIRSMIAVPTGRS